MRQSEFCKSLAVAIIYCPCELQPRILDRIVAAGEADYLLARVTDAFEGKRLFHLSTDSMLLPILRRGLFHTATEPPPRRRGSLDVCRRASTSGVFQEIACSEPGQRFFAAAGVWLLLSFMLGCSH